MSSSEIVQKYYKAFNDKNWQGMLDLLDANIVHEISQGPSQKGIPAFKDFLAVMDKHYDEVLKDIVLMTDSSGKRVAAEFICEGVYKSSVDGAPKAIGQKYHLRVGAFFDLSGNKIKRVSNHYNIKDWIKQIGG